MTTPQDKARLEAVKRSWEQKRRVTQSLSRIKTKIAVYSGKGGVGKTTVAVNLAATLAKQANKVGLLDADIDCPNVTKAIGVTERPDYHKDESGEVLIPAEAWGVKVVSMGFFQKNEEEAIIWRGPMIHNMINQFLQMTNWGELDYLIVDLPPGTSDAPLTIMQTLPLDGFVIVATPQELARLDAKRSINMIRKLNLRVLGIVENYSGEVFGSGAGEALAKELSLPFLGSFSLRPDYKDMSKPTILTSAVVREEYKKVVENLKAVLASLPKGQPAFRPANP